MKQFIKLTPIMLLAGLVISGTDTLIAAPLAAIYAAAICAMTEKIGIDEVIDSAVDSAKNGMIVFFVMMLAYGVAEMFMTSGVGAVVIETSLKVGVTGTTVALVTFIVSCILSVSTGTSWGTYAAAIPIFLWLNHIVGGNPVLTMCAAAGGAGFGDNIALISDTTIFSSGIQGVDIRDRFQHQLVWTLTGVAVSAVLFYVVSLAMGLPTAAGTASEAIAQIPETSWANLAAERPSAITLLEQVTAGGIPFFMFIPVILVIALAIMKFNTIICLFSGIFSAAILGGFIGTIESFGHFTEILYDSFADAGSWVIIMMMWVVAFGGIMGRMNAFQPIADFFIRISKNVRQLMTYSGLMCIIGNMMLSDEVAQMATIGPVQKDIIDKNISGTEEDKYPLRLRAATFSDALGVMGSQLIPWHVCSIYYVAMAIAVYPLFDFNAMHLIQYNFFAWITVISLLVLTFTGWDRFFPNFAMTAEPEVQISKHVDTVENEN